MFIFYLLNQFLDPYSRRSIAKKLNNGHSQIFCNSWSYFCDYKCHTNIFVFFFPSLYILSTHSKLLYRFISRYKKVFFFIFFIYFFDFILFFKKIRLESISRSPIYNHFSETLNGTTTIRAFRSTNLFIKENQQR